MEKNIYKEKEIKKSFDKEILKELFKYFKPEFKFFLICFVLIIGITGVDLSIPYLIKIAIDDNISNYDAPMIETDGPINEDYILFNEKYYTRIDEETSSYFTIKKEENEYYLVNEETDYSKILTNEEYQLFRVNDKENLIKLALILVSLLILNYILSFLNIFTLNYASQKIIYNLRSDLFKHLQLLPLKFFDRNPVGRLVTRVTNDMKNISELFTSVLVTALKDVFLIIGTIIVMISIDFKLALLSLATVPVVTIISYYFRIEARKIQRDVKKRLAKINATLAENINGMKIIQIFNQEDKVFNEFDILNNKYYQSSIRETKIYAIFKPSMNLMYSISLSLIIFYSGNHSMQSAIELGVMVAFVQYIQQLFRPIFDLAEKFNIMQSAMASSERVFILLKEENHIKEPLIEKSFSKELKGEIKFENVWFSYADEPKEENYILKDISFTAKQGETIALVGATGSGKTTIISLLNRFYDINKGSIIIDGENIKNVKKANLRARIGFVLQDVFLFAGDIKSNIRLNEESITDEKIKEVSKYVNAHEFIKELENLYDEEVTEGGSTLSKGERQLLSFARALAFDPDILVLDEATSNIDTHTEVLIQDAIEKLMKDRTTIIIAHRLSTIKNADKIIVLNKGEIKEVGTHNELLDKGGLYYDLHQLQYIEE